jgi:hypothetical protein
VTFPGSAQSVATVFTGAWGLMIHFFWPLPAPPLIGVGPQAGVKAFFLDAGEDRRTLDGGGNDQAGIRSNA